MQTFLNQSLREKPHLAVFSSSKVGDFVVTTPLLRGLKEKYPNCQLDFFGSEITKEFESNCPYIDWRFSLHSDRQNLSFILEREIKQRCEIAGCYDLAINCDADSEINLAAIDVICPSYVAGVLLSPDSLNQSDREPIQKMVRDKDWNSIEFLQRYRGVINSNYIGEIFCKIAYVETDFFKLELPSKSPNFVVPDILINVTATRPAKMWLADYWQTIINWCNVRGFTVGLVGSHPTAQQNLYHSGQTEDYLLKTTELIDLRGKTSLIELAGALRQAKAFICVDSGPLHIAAAVGCPTLAIFGNDTDGDGASPIRLWAPRHPNVKLAVSDYKCTLCQDNHFSNPFCLLENHLCMIRLLPQEAIAQLQQLLNN
jgi:heptosyltransferase III